MRVAEQFGESPGDCHNIAYTPTFGTIRILLNGEGARLSKTVLIIEDNAHNRDIYCTLLKHAGYRCLEAEDAETGIALAVAELPNLILLDIGLPRMDGWVACSVLKSNEKTRHIPVVAVTAHAFPEEIKRGGAAGFDAYIAKPVEPRVVFDHVVRFIGPP